jgi:hypothetical protein
MSAPLQCHFPLDTRTRAHACTGTGQHRQGAGSRRRTAHKTSLRIIQIFEAESPCKLGVGCLFGAKMPQTLSSADVRLPSHRQSTSPTAPPFHNCTWQRLLAAAISYN